MDPKGRGSIPRGSNLAEDGMARKKKPSVAAIKAARSAAGLTQEAAAERIHGELRTWPDWEAGKAGMHPGLFELFLIKTGQPTAR